jgi:hypothetical protein
MALQTSPTTEEKRKLNTLLLTAKLDYETRVKITMEINTMTEYKEYEGLMYFLESQQPSIHEIPNPSQQDIINHLNRFIH